MTMRVLSFSGIRRASPGGEALRPRMMRNGFHIRTASGNQRMTRALICSSWSGGMMGSVTWSLMNLRRGDRSGIRCRGSW